MNEHDVEAVAYHEAGHACAARACGLDVTVARMGDLGQPLDPHAAQARVGPRVGLQWPRSRAERQYLRTPEGHQDLAVIALSGPLAEARYRGLRAEDMAPWWAGAWRGDLDNLHRHHDVGMLAPLHQRAAALVNDLWPIIERAAAALQERGELTGDELDALLTAGQNSELQIPEGQLPRESAA
jgi:hypothetical protein